MGDFRDDISAIRQPFALPRWSLEAERMSEQESVFQMACVLAGSIIHDPRFDSRVMEPPLNPQRVLSAVSYVYVHPAPESEKAAREAVANLVSMVLIWNEACRLEAAKAMANMEEDIT